MYAYACVRECVCVSSCVVRYMRRMFHDCRLVHGDLSEYNILCHQGQIYFIDVSQVGVTLH
jgi:serine/threonine-protein kinase RIO1